MSAKPYLSVVIHDVAPANWVACQRVLSAIQEVDDIPTTLLVVPRYHWRPSETGFETQLSQLLEEGHELALHGYSHLDEGMPDGWMDYIKRRIYTDGEGEFSSLGQREALSRLRTGIRWFQHRHWPLHGFVAPAWLMSEGSWEAIRTLPFDYTATLQHVYALPQVQAHRSACLTFSTRSAWRRMASLPRNAWVRSRWSQQPLVRLELHPHDADFPMIKKMWTQTLADLLQKRHAVTLSEGVHRMGEWMHGLGSSFCEAPADGPATVPYLYSMWPKVEEPRSDCAEGAHP